MTIVPRCVNYKKFISLGCAPRFFICLRMPRVKSHSTSVRLFPGNYTRDKHARKVFTNSSLSATRCIARDLPSFTVCAFVKRNSQSEPERGGVGRATRNFVHDEDERDRELSRMCPRVGGSPGRSGSRLSILSFSPSPPPSLSALLPDSSASDQIIMTG